MQSERIDRPKEAAICERTYAFIQGGRESQVIARIWRPVPRKSKAGAFDNFECYFEIVGLPQERKHVVPAIDSMQALILAISAIHGYLREYRNEITWLDLPYEDNGIFINVLDAGRRRRIEAVLDEDQYAMTQQRIVRERAKAALERD